MNFKIFENEFALNEKTWSHLISMLNSEDDIGVVLRAHLLTEKMLEAWCSAASNNIHFFDGFGDSVTMSYAAKLKLASNFGLNDFSYKELKAINKIRNVRSHQIYNAEITDKEIQIMTDLISNGGQKELVNSDSFGMWVDGKEVFLNNTESTNREKFIAALSGVIIRMSRQARELDPSPNFTKLL